MVMVAKPIIPQTRIRFTGVSTPRILPSVGSTIAVPVVHDWGPLGSELAKPEVLLSFAEWTDRYGDSDTEGRTAVAGAFAGQGLAGAGGAGGVIPYRMGTGAVRASKAITNTTPATAITLTARWAGTRANNISWIIDVDPADATRDRLRILYNGATIEVYSYANTDIASLVAAINGNAQSMVTAVLGTDGVRLTATTGTSMSAGTAGTNGAAPDGAAVLAALAGLEFQPFTLLAFSNLTDGSIQASVLSWVKQQEVNNRPVIWVAGGLAGETLSTAIARSTALADPHVVNFGVGTYHDDLLNKDLSTAQLAPRIAGILAIRGQKSALTGSEIGGLHVVVGPQQSEAEVAVQRGVTVLIRTDSDEADVRIAKGVTTFTSTTDVNRPLQIFSEPRFIRIMDIFIRNMRRWGDKTIVGSVPVNNDTRDAVRSYGGGLLQALIDDGLLLTQAEGATDDPFIVTPVTTDDTVPFSFGWQFAYTANYLLGEGRVR